jgi:hypothetical protein
MVVRRRVGRLRSIFQTCLRILSFVAGAQAPTPHGAFPQNDCVELTRGSRIILPCRCVCIADPDLFSRLWWAGSQTISNARKMLSKTVAVAAATSLLFASPAASFVPSSGLSLGQAAPRTAPFVRERLCSQQGSCRTANTPSLLSLRAQADSRCPT